jgi:DNA-binding LytR/AlgR family response regulator
MRIENRCRCAGAGCRCTLRSQLRPESYPDKSVFVNLSKVRSLSPALSGRFEATLENGEKVIISRQYVGDLKKRLGI